MTKTDVMTRRSTIPVMLGQSLEVLSNPGTASQEGAEERRTLTQAISYMGVAAIIAALLQFPLGLQGMSGGLLNVLVSFFVFTGLIYVIGKAEGGTGSFDETAYAFALFIAPLSLIVPLATFVMLYPTLGLADSLIPVLAVIALLVLALQAYFAYVVGRQSRINIINQHSAPAALAGAVIATWFVQMVIAIVGAGWVLVVSPA